MLPKTTHSIPPFWNNPTRSIFPPSQSSLGVLGTYKPRLHRNSGWLEESWHQEAQSPNLPSLVQTTFIQLGSRNSSILGFTSTLTASSPQKPSNPLSCISEEQPWKWWPASGIWVCNWLTTPPGASTLPVWWEAPMSASTSSGGLAYQSRELSHEDPLSSEPPQHPQDCGPTAAPQQWLLLCNREGYTIDGV